MTKIPNLEKLSLKNLSVATSKISGENIFSINVSNPENIKSSMNVVAMIRGIVIRLCVAIIEDVELGKYYSYLRKE